jgi:hypothetical protein
MVWDVSFSCDICGKTKGESNHWWMASAGPPVCSEEQESADRFTLLPWSAESCCSPDLHHLCGQSCAMQALARFMTVGSLHSGEPEKAAANPAARGPAREKNDVAGRAVGD